MSSFELDPEVYSAAQLTLIANVSQAARELDRALTSASSAAATGERPLGAQMIFDEIEEAQAKLLGVVRGRLALVPTLADYEDLLSAETAPLASCGAADDTNRRLAMVSSEIQALSGRESAAGWSARVIVSLDVLKTAVERMAEVAEGDGFDGSVNPSLVSCARPSAAELALSVKSLVSLTKGELLSALNASATALADQIYPDAKKRA